MGDDGIGIESDHFSRRFEGLELGVCRRLGEEQPEDDDIFLDENRRYRVQFDARLKTESAAACVEVNLVVFDVILFPLSVPENIMYVRAKARTSDGLTGVLILCMDR